MGWNPVAALTLQAGIAERLHRVRSSALDAANAPHVLGVHIAVSTARLPLQRVHQCGDGRVAHSPAGGGDTHALGALRGEDASGEECETERSERET